MATGTVKWFSAEKGYGFVALDEGGDDVFVHATAVEVGGFKTLDDGQRIQFDVVEDPKGRHATNVRVI